MGERQRLAKELKELELEAEKTISRLKTSFEAALARENKARDDRFEAEREFQEMSHQLHKRIHGLKLQLEASAPPEIGNLIKDLRLKKEDLVREATTIHTYVPGLHVTVTESNQENIKRGQDILDRAIEEAKSLIFTDVIGEELESRLAGVRERALNAVQKELRAKPAQIKREGRWYSSTPPVGTP